MVSALNCSLWTLYGLPVVNFQVLVVTINAAGTVLELFYIVLYIFYSEGPPKVCCPVIGHSFPHISKKVENIQPESSEIYSLIESILQYRQAHHGN